jgi:hypothetical protein
MSGLEAAVAAHDVAIVDRDDDGAWLMVRDPGGNHVVFEA